MQLCDFEKDVLRLLDGQPQDSIKGWGAGLSAALEPLKNGGFIERSMEGNVMKYCITEKGRQAISD